MARKQLSKKTRFEVFKRDSFTCQYCGSVPPKVVLHVDHIVPVASGGENNIDNLITSCESCNQGKGATSLTSIPESLVQKTKRMREIESQVTGYNEVVIAKTKRVENEAWFVARTLENDDELCSYSANGIKSIKNFISLIGFEETVEAAGIAFSNKPSNSRRRFLYFCGVCWNRARNLKGDQ